MNEAEIRLASRAFGIPSWPREVNITIQMLAIGLAVYAWVGLGGDAAWAFAWRYVVGWSIIALLCQAISSMSLKTSIYLGLVCHGLLVMFLMAFFILT